MPLQLPLAVLQSAAQLAVVSPLSHVPLPHLAELGTHTLLLLHTRPAAQPPAHLPPQPSSLPQIAPAAHFGVHEPPPHALW
jgi:hypothetical protein